MRTPGSTPLTVALSALALTTWACDRAPSADASEAEAQFAAVQARGEQAMGVDQYTSTHLFDALEDGGRIELQRDVDDSTGVEVIRKHLVSIATAFASADFSTPAFVHMGDVPGTAVMAAKRDRIEYRYSDLPRGGELRLVTSDPEALRAIHDFMAFQREEHRAGGAVHEPHAATPHDGRAHEGAEHQQGPRGSTTPK